MAPGLSTAEELSPLCYWFGHAVSGGAALGADLVPQFKRLVASLAAAVGRRHGAAAPNPPPPGGVLVNSCGWVDGVVPDDKLAELGVT